MASDARERMIAGATRLLAARGPQETSFAQVIALTGVPRGSIYHHFPEGKEQLLAAALDSAGGRTADLLNQIDGVPATEVIAYFLGLWRELLLRNDYRVDCSILATTIATDSAQLLGHAAAVFRAWRRQLATMLTHGGLTDPDAQRFAVTLIAAAEGAVVICRAERSLEPFDLVAEQLADHVASLVR
ncbi:TetR/AcrR family transcriptional regulator [Rhodococcus erythropolis]|uniref:TetR/AcrR family transcriptional regulator n=1 Tax=Rhodococcus erythropolis TaxID=1833 RepID=UPI00366B5684